MTHDWIYKSLFSYRCDLLLFPCSKGSVAVNFTVYYVKVADSEVLLLQDYITTTGKMYNLSTVLQEAKPMESKIIKFFSTYIMNHIRGHQPPTAATTQSCPSAKRKTVYI